MALALKVCCCCWLSAAAHACTHSPATHPRQAHPDKQPAGQSDAQAAAAVARFHAIAKAWETLRDDAIRAAYDAQLSSACPLRLSCVSVCWCTDLHSTPAGICAGLERFGPVQDTVDLDDMHYDEGFAHVACGEREQTGGGVGIGVGVGVGRRALGSTSSAAYSVGLHATQQQQQQQQQKQKPAADEQAPAGATESTHFGFKTVAKEAKETLAHRRLPARRPSRPVAVHTARSPAGPRTQTDTHTSTSRTGVQEVAGKYDVMNDFMSAGVHRLWKDHYIRTLGPTASTRLLDVAGGTGDIAFRFLDHIRQANGGGSDAAALGSAHVTVVDINPAMLAVGRERAIKLGYPADSPHIDFQEGNAEHLDHIPDASVDAYTIAFGIRNCTNVDRVVREAYRVLKPGGRFMVLEFSSVNNPLIRSVYDLYSFQVIPKLGELVANDRASYEYLVESIRKFPPQPEFAAMIRDAGFTVVGQGWEDLTFGVAAIHSGFKL
ncbi:ubiE/COQ5 methyltransferase family-domain-containing protein [Entophlyctis helioformis]|nr:ubiE/COQ5 methyltransferase family-domain-containing protein [Entophlyctis helioformis]